MDITAIILTKNEERNIDRCLQSVKSFKEIIIIDDFSKDSTLARIHKILKNKNYRIIKRKLSNDFADQRNFAMGKASNDWVLFIDADEELGPGLKSKIKNLSFNKDAYALRRRDFFWGRELKHGEVQTVRESGLIRLVKKDTGNWSGSVHEAFFTGKNIGRLNGYLNHYPHPSLKEFIKSINMYSTLRAKELYKKGIHTSVINIIVWPAGKFIYNYFIKMGFLDGPPGFAYAFLMSFHSFLVRAKLYQFQKKVSE